MGFYIQTPEAKGKANHLVKAYGASRLRVTPQWNEVPEGKAAICVVDNGAFEAAGLAYSEEELRAFSEPTDRRPKTWLLMETKLAHKLAGRDECQDR